jgi:hypothetical protein
MLSLRSGNGASLQINNQGGRERTMTTKRTDKRSSHHNAFDSGLREVSILDLGKGS